MARRVERLRDAGTRTDAPGDDVAVPVDGPAGEYHLMIAVADPSGAVTETDESTDARASARRIRIVESDPTTRRARRAAP